MTVHGLNDVLRNMDRFDDDMRDRVEKALTKGGMIIEAHAKEYAPVLTGTLRRSITTQTHKKTASAVIVRVGTNMEYAAFQEFGTSRMAAHPYLRPAAHNHKREIVRAIKQELKI